MEVTGTLDVLERCGHAIGWELKPKYIQRSVLYEVSGVSVVQESQYLHSKVRNNSLNILFTTTVLGRSLGIQVLHSSPLTK